MTKEGSFYAFTNLLFPLSHVASLLPGVPSPPEQGSPSLKIICKYYFSSTISFTLSGGRPISFLFPKCYTALGASQAALVAKNLPASEGDMRDAGSIPGLGKSPRGGHGNPVQYACLENPMDRGACVHRIYGP